MNLKKKLLMLTFLRRLFSAKHSDEKPSIPTLSPSLTVEIKGLIAQAKTLEALEILHAAGVQDTVLLKAQFIDARSAYNSKKISYEEWSLVNNRINSAILNCLEPEKESVSPVNLNRPKPAVSAPTPPLFPDEPPAETARTAVQQLLLENKLEEALERSHAWNATFWMINSRYDHAKKQWFMGLLGEEEWKRIQAQVQAALKETLALP